MAIFLKLKTKKTAVKIRVRFASRPRNVSPGHLPYISTILCPLILSNSAPSSNSHSNSVLEEKAWSGLVWRIPQEYSSWSSCNHASTSQTNSCVQMGHGTWPCTLWSGGMCQLLLEVKKAVKQIKYTNPTIYIHTSILSFYPYFRGEKLSNISKGIQKSRW